MGLMARMLELKNAETKTLPESRGPASVVNGESGDYSRNLELWGPPGDWSLPPDGTFGIRLPVGGSDRWGSVIATQHYKTPRPTLAKGERVVGSTNADGTVLKASTAYRADGTQELNGNTKRLVLWDDLTTVLATFLTALKAHLTAAGDPSSGTLTLDISSTKTTTIKTGG